MLQIFFIACSTLMVLVRLVLKVTVVGNISFCNLNCYDHLSQINLLISLSLESGDAEVAEHFEVLRGLACIPSQVHTPTQIFPKRYTDFHFLNMYQSYSKEISPTTFSLVKHDPDEMIWKSTRLNIFQTNFMLCQKYHRGLKHGGRGRAEAP